MPTNFAGVKVEWAFRGLKKKWYDMGFGMASGLKRAAEELLRETLPITPIDMGPLRESGRVEVTGRWWNAEASVVFGNDQVDYAIVVHENPEAWHEPPTQYKYLEATARRIHKKLGRTAGREIAEVVR